MRILAFKPGHDASLAYLRDNELVFCVEAEKNSNVRHEGLNEALFLSALTRLEQSPDILACSGWNQPTPLRAGYKGFTSETAIARPTQILGKDATYFTSSHERSHLFCSFGLSELPHGQAFYFLDYEGGFGDFYRVDEQFEVTKLGTPMVQPGFRFALLHPMALGAEYHGFYHTAAGKLMALAAFSDREPLSDDEEKYVDHLLKYYDPENYPWFEFEVWGMGVENERFRNLVGVVSDRIFDTFYRFAEENMKEQLPLLIGGGCGLNCDWNRRWKDCGLFPSVFVPPCTNDSGAALGTAIEAQYHTSGNAKIKWTVYAGEEFVEDCPVSPEEYEIKPLDVSAVAEMLSNGAVIAWVQGRYEMGPRALGHRSLLASPFSPEMRDRLNKIKDREEYRPVAPICTEEEVGTYFDWNEPSPYMLYFQQVRDERLQAVAHVDGSARVQTVNQKQCAVTHELLRAFNELAGVPVLCNTSLNFPGMGFINQMSDLLRYQRERTLDGLVVNNKLILPRRA